VSERVQPGGSVGEGQRVRYRGGSEVLGTVTADLGSVSVLVRFDNGVEMSCRRDRLEVVP
jgi:hypothetical protein